MEWITHSVVYSLALTHEIKQKSTVNEAWRCGQSQQTIKDSTLIPDQSI